MKRPWFLLSVFLKGGIVSSLFLIFPSRVFPQTDYSKVVNPFIGTGGHGHTFPGVVAPFGMVQLSPDTRLTGWDGCSGYHYSDSVIYGFSHTHLSGTGCSDYGDILIMPMYGDANFDNKVYSSKFSHANEKAHAGFYSVHLDDEDIDVELTTTTRAGFHKYTFNTEGKVNFILDMRHRDKLLDGKIRIVNGTTVEGYRRSEAWAKDQRLYFRMEFSKAFSGRQLVASDEKMTHAAFEFDVKKGEQVLVKVSLSAVDYEGAEKNMKAELSRWNFAKANQDCEALWNKELNKIQVKGGTADQQVIFYTALYHCFIHPSIYSDVDGRYLGRDFKIHTVDSGMNYYTVFSLWDTFRALHPLFNIVQRERNLDFIKTFLKQYEQCGRLPMWELSSNETNCMIGYHAVSVIADAYAKGISGFDERLALKAMLDASENFHPDLKIFNTQGYLSSEDEHESVSKNLEYSYNAFCVSSFIHKFLEQNKKLTHEEREKYSADESLLLWRSHYWKNIFDSKTGFMRGRQNGGWYKPFNPFEVNQNYTEANAWQYAFFVPNDLNDLITAHGGESKFEQDLDKLFSAENRIDGRQQADITGMIGQYAHGNEPSHNFAYLYNVIGKPEKTQQRVNAIIENLYRNSPDGLSGNEDCGQMSAWYVMSALGFYSICPGDADMHYQATYSIFDSAEIRSNQSTILLNVNRYLKANPYFPYLNLEHIIDKTSTSDVKLYPNKRNSDTFIPAPIISSNSKSFRDSILISIEPPYDFMERSNYKIMISQNESDFIEYKEPIYINDNRTITAKIVTINDSSQSRIATASFIKIPHNWSVKLNIIYDPQYTGGGDEGVIDGLHGDENWRKGNWQGYWGKDFEAVIDLNETKNISEVTVGCLQDVGPWIMFPSEIIVEVSADGKKFEQISNMLISEKEKTEKISIENFTLHFKKQKARFVKIKALNFGKLPAGHESAGEPAWLFVDEIQIK